MRAFVTVGIGADFGDRTHHGGFFTAAGLAAFGPPGTRTLNDVHGLMVFECDPPSIFVTVNPFTVTVSAPHQRLVDAMTNAIESGGLSEKSRLLTTYLLHHSVNALRMPGLRF